MAGYDFLNAHESESGLFSPSLAMRDAKMLVSTLVYHINLCDNLDVIRMLEDEVRRLHSKSQQKRLILQNEQKEKAA